MWRGRAEWDQGIEVDNVTRAYWENASDSTTEAGKWLNGDGKCM
jgi:hypothetical protein